jgi:hypothetical protein
MNVKSPFRRRSAYLGVTEPAMYGINLKYRFPMLCAMIGSGLAGLLCGLNGVLANGIGVGPAGHPLHPANLLAGVRHGDGYRGGGADYPHHRGLSAQVRQGTLQIV